MTTDRHRLEFETDFLAPLARQKERAAPMHTVRCSCGWNGGPYPTMGEAYRAATGHEHHDAPAASHESEPVNRAEPAK